MRTFYPFAFVVVMFFLVSIVLSGVMAYSRPLDPCGGLEGKKVQFISDNGMFLSRCRDCGPGAYRDSVAVKEGYRMDHSIWNVERYRDACGLQAQNGKYMAICNNCWRGGKYDYSVFVHAPTLNATSAHWIITPHVDGTYTIMSKDISMYVGRCNNCVPKSAYSNAAFVHFSKANIIDPGLWRVILAHDPDAGRPRERNTCISFKGAPRFLPNRIINVRTY